MHLHDVIKCSTLYQHPSYTNLSIAQSIQLFLEPCLLFLHSLQLLRTLGVLTILLLLLFTGLLFSLCFFFSCPLPGVLK